MTRQHGLICMWCCMALIPMAIAGQVQAESVRAVTLYSSFSDGRKSFLAEYDKPLASLEWKVRKFENLDLPKLVAALPETDFVIGCSVYNHEHPQDFATIKEPFLAWLENGGVALFTDASYATSLGQGIGRWGDRFSLTMELASAHTKPSPETRVVRAAEGCCLATTPNDLAPLATDHGHWAHFKTCAGEWKPALIDSDGKPILVFQQVGKGLLAVTNLSCMNRASGIELGRALLENLWVCAAFAGQGMELRSLTFGPAITGKHVCDVELANLSDREEAVHMTLKLTGPDGAAIERRSSAALPPKGESALAAGYEIARRGRHELELALSAGNADRPFWSMKKVSEYIDRAQQAMERRRPLWAVPQAFGYEDKPGSWRVPTPAEERCMTYQALVHGARGLVYYTYFDGSFDLTKAPPLLDELTRLAGEVKVLAPALMAPGEGQLLRTGPNDCIHVLIRKHNGQNYVLAVNVAEDAAKSISVPVGADEGTAEVLFENRRLKSGKGSVTDDFEGYGTHVYLAGQR